LCSVVDGIGCDFNSKNNEGKTAVDVAEEGFAVSAEKKKEIIDVIRSFSKEKSQNAVAATASYVETVRLNVDTDYGGLPQESPQSAYPPRSFSSPLYGTTSEEYSGLPPCSPSTVNDVRTDSPRIAIPDEYGSMPLSPFEVDSDYGGMLPSADL